MVDYDSILTATDSNVVNRTALYRQGVVQPDRTLPMREKVGSIGDDDYVVGGMLLMFALLAVVVHQSFAMLLNRLQNFFATKRQFVLSSGGDRGTEKLNVMLLIAISALSASIIFLDHLWEKNGLDAMPSIPYRFLGIAAVAIMGLVYAKAGIYALVNWAFYNRESRRQWMEEYQLVNSLTAFFLYPLALLAVFLPQSRQLVTAGVILVVISYELLLFYKMLVYFKAKKYGYLINVLYFCSVELLPTLVVGAWAVGDGGSVIVKNFLY